MEEDYEIRKGVPMPAPNRQRGLTNTMRLMRYMDSIVIPADKLSSAHPCAAQVGIKIKTRKNIDGTVTVWCVSSPVDSGPPRKPGRPRKPGPPLAIPQPASGARHKFVLTAAEPSLGLPEGYYAQDDPYGSTLWVEGRPPSSPTAQATPATPAANNAPDIFS